MKCISSSNKESSLLRCDTKIAAHWTSLACMLVTPEWLLLNYKCICPRSLYHCIKDTSAWPIYVQHATVCFTFLYYTFEQCSHHISLISLASPFSSFQAFICNSHQTKLRCLTQTWQASHFQGHKVGVTFHISHFGEASPLMCKHTHKVFCCL